MNYSSEIDRHWKQNYSEAMGDGIGIQDELYSSKGTFKRSWPAKKTAKLLPLQAATRVSRAAKMIWHFVGPEQCPSTVGCPVCRDGHVLPYSDEQQ